MFLYCIREVPVRIWARTPTDMAEVFRGCSVQSGEGGGNILKLNHDRFFSQPFQLSICRYPVI